MRNNNLPRGLRNNNPGNIRKNSDVFQGEKTSSDKEFKQFKSMAYGYRAIFKILSNYYRNYKLDTIRKMIGRWAPPKENHTEKYIQFVSDYAGIPADDPININDREQMIRIVAGMSRFENGREADMSDVIAGMICGMLAIAGILFLSGCRTKIQPVAIENRIDSIYIDKLVPYPMPVDSASIRALMECDENGKVVLRWLDMANTKNVELMFALDSLGNVIANMRVSRDTLYLPSKEVYVDRKVEVPILVERELSRWEKIKIEVGRWAIGLLSGCLIVGIGYVVRWLIRKERS